MHGRLVIAACTFGILGVAVPAHAAAKRRPAAPVAAAPEPAAHGGPVLVFLDRGGEQRPAQNGEPAVSIPAFGGGDRTWRAVVDCVRHQYAPFQVEIVDRRPAGAPYITAVVGGLASQLGLDDGTTNGVGPYDGTVIRDAEVHIFSQVGTGEGDVENLCAVTAHEVGHALGLDHEVYCGDIMSYYLDQCGARRFIDADAPCGESAARACGDGTTGQNSYRRLARLVGLRPGAAPVAPDPVAPPDPVAAPDVEPDAEPDAAPAPADDAAAPAVDGGDPWAHVHDATSTSAPAPSDDSDAAPSDEVPNDRADEARPARWVRHGHGHRHDRGRWRYQVQSRN